MLFVNNAKAFAPVVLSGAAATTPVLTPAAGSSATISDNPLMAGALVVNVNSTAGWNNGMLVLAGTEAMQVTGVVSATQASIVRARLGTSAASHNQNTPIVPLQPGTLHTVNIVTAASAGTATLTFYNNPSLGAGAVTAGPFDTTKTGSFLLDVGCTLGLTAVTTDDGTHHATVVVAAG